MYTQDKFQTVQSKTRYNYFFLFLFPLVWPRSPSQCPVSLIDPLGPGAPPASITLLGNWIIKVVFFFYCVVVLCLDLSLQVKEYLYILSNKKCAQKRKKGFVGVFFRNTVFLPGPMKHTSRWEGSSTSLGELNFFFVSNYLAKSSCFPPHFKLDVRCEINYVRCEIIDLRNLFQFKI